MFARTCRSPAQKDLTHWAIIKISRKNAPACKKRQKENLLAAAAAAAAHTIKHKIREKKTRRLAFSADVHALRILCRGIKRTGTGRRAEREKCTNTIKAGGRAKPKAKAAVKAEPKQKPVRHRVSSQQHNPSGFGIINFYLVTIAGIKSARELI